MSSTPAAASAATVSPPPATESSFPALVRSRDAPGERHRAGIERLDLEGAERAVPHQGRAARRLPFRRARSTSARHRGSSGRRGRRWRRRPCCAAPALNSPATTTSTGSSTSHLAALAFSRISQRRRAEVLLATATCRPAMPCACRKVLAMPPPMISLSTLPTRLPSRSSLVETLAPPTTAHTGRLGLPSALSSASSSACISRPASGRQAVGDALGRGMRAMRGREGVVDIDVAQRRELVDEARVVLLLFLVEAQVLEQQHVAGLQRRAPLPRPAGRCNPRRRRPACRAPWRAARPAACSDISGTRLPSGRPKWLSTITLAPLSASSFEVGAARSMRVASVTLPFFIGTLRSTRTSTRLPETARNRSS